MTSITVNDSVEMDFEEIKNCLSKGDCFQYNYYTSDGKKETNFIKKFAESEYTSTYIIDDVEKKITPILYDKKMLEIFLQELSAMNVSLKWMQNFDVDGFKWEVVTKDNIKEGDIVKYCNGYYYATCTLSKIEIEKGFILTGIHNEMCLLEDMKVLKKEEK